MRTQEWKTNLIWVAEKFPVRGQKVRGQRVTQGTNALEERKLGKII